MMAPRSRHSASSSGAVCRSPRRRSLSCRTHSLSPSAGTRQVAARNGSPLAADFRLYPDNPLHWALLHVCDARIIDDPYNIYKLEVHKEEHGFYDIVLSVDFWGVNPDFWKPGNSYPCRVLIKTTGGVRIVTLKPLAALSEEQFQALTKQAAFEFVNNCYLPRHRLFEELDWPIEQLIEQPGLHYIQVRAAGLPPGEQVDLIGRNGEQLGRFAVNRSGMLLVTTLSQQQEGQGTALRLRRSPGQVGPAALPGRMLSHSHHQSQQTHTLIPHLEPGIPLDGGHGAHAAGSGMLGKICPPDAPAPLKR